MVTSNVGYCTYWPMALPAYLLLAELVLLPHLNPRHALVRLGVVRLDAHFQLELLLIALPARTATGFK